jgi:hypothetical protein
MQAGAAGRGDRRGVLRCGQEDVGAASEAGRGIFARQPLEADSPGRGAAHGVCVHVK